MANKKFGYDIKVNYGNIHDDTQKVIKGLQELDKAIGRLKNVKDISINVKAGGDQFKKLTEYAAQLDRSLKTASASGATLSNSLGQVTSRFASVRDMTKNVSKEVTDASRNIEKLGQSLQRSSMTAKEQSFSGQIASLKRQAEENYRQNFATNPMAYAQNARALNTELQKLYQAQKVVNLATRENIGLLKQWGIDTENVGHRLGYLATRMVASFALDKTIQSFTQMAHVEKDMAGFAQVMKHGTGQTNAFARSLMEVDPSHMVNGLQLSGQEAEHFKHELEEMQSKLQGLAVKYGTTSHEMIESAKLWGRAYKDNNTVLALTDAATKLAVADAFDIVSANKALESSIMQWGFQIHNANDAVSVSSRIIDSWTALAHNYTVSAQTLSEANKRMAQSAAEVGVSFHSAQALVAVMARKTQADGGEIGNALKSIFGSIHSKKAISALQDFGIEVYKVGENGEKSFRKVDDVLLDLMIKAQGSKESMEGLLKAISGGKWQWNKADAMLDLNEYLEALKQSSSSMGFTNAQVGMQLDTIETKLKQISAQWEKMTSSSHTLGSAIKATLDVTLGLLKWLDSIPSSMYVIAGATLAALIAQRRWGSVSQLVIKNVSRLWTEATTHVNGYIVAAQEASVATSGVGRAMATTSGAIKGVGSGLKALAGGWLGIIMIVAMVVETLSDLYTASQDTTKSLYEDYSAHQKLAQQYEETAARMEEARGVAEQYITIHSRLQEKIKDTATSEQERITLQNQVQESEQGLIAILGEEETAYVLAADSAEEQSQRAQDAITRKKEELQKSAEDERAAIAETANQLRAATNANIDSLKSEETSWIRRMAILKEYIGWVGLAQMAYAKLLQIIGEWKEKRANARIEDLKKQLEEDKAEAEARRAEGDLQGAQAFENRMAETEHQMNISQESLSMAKQWQDEAQDSIAKLNARAIANIRVEQAEKLNELDMTANSGHAGGGAIGGGNTGDYARSELPDGAGDESKGKKGKSSSKKQKNPLAETRVGAAIDFLVKQGFSVNQAYGIVGNLQVESFDDIRPWAEDGTGAYGIAQWQGSRLEDLKQFARDNQSDYTAFETQLAFLVYELQHKERGNWQKVLSESVNGTPEEYASYFDKYVERSSQEHNWVRQQKARALANNGYGDEDKTADNRANKLIEKQKKVENIALKLAKEQLEMENAMKPKEQADFAKETASLTEKIKSMQKEIDELLKLNPQANVKSLQETMKKYEATMTHRLQDKYRDKDYDEAVQMMKDRHENEDLDRDIAGTSENFWVSDVRTVNRLVEEYMIKVKKYQDMVAAFKRGDSEYTEADIRKAGLELKKLEVQIKKTGNALNKNIKQQTHDVFHGLIFEGKKFKDVWKDLWKQLAEDALKMIFKIQDGNGGLLQNLLKRFDKKYQKGINPVLGGDGKDGKNIGGIDESLNHQMLTAQSTRNLDKNFETFMANTQNGTAWQQATFTDAVIYGNVQGEKGNVDLPETTKDKDGKTDVSQYINAGMKIAGGGNNKWMGTLSTVMGFAKQFGLLKFAGGGSVDKDQLVRVGEGDKKEWIIPTSDKARGRQLLNQAAKDLGVGVTSGIEPKWQHEETKNGAMSDATKRQDRLMNQMVANTHAMTKGMNYMANNSSGSQQSIAQPVFVKQTISDQDFLSKYQKLIALGKLKQA
jgi:TP901 family phage tail tape measure protein|nr:MAG TPA: tail tape measure [Caudoviricetes sp.]